MRHDVAVTEVQRTVELARVAELVTGRRALTDVLRGALASLRTLVPFDLAVIYELVGEELHARVAEGPLADGRVAHHRLDVGRFPTIRRALLTRQPIPLEEHHHAGEEGDPYDGVLDLPDGHSCMVVPLFAEDRALGLITLDRTSCGVYPESTVALAGVYGQLVGIAMSYAKQTEELRRYEGQLREHNRLLRNETQGSTSAGTKLDASRNPGMIELARTARQVAASDLPVLVRGATGTGKEVLAEAIHEWSRRASGPFVKLNCAAIPDNLVESELFGHVRGAFSGASRERPGRFLTANGGTILLDEIGDMPLAAQAKLLRVLQEGAFEAVGSDTTVHVDVRVLAATNVELEAAVTEGRFREDLYYRLAAFPLSLPPLRERPEDVVDLAVQFLDRVGHRHGGGPWTLSERSQRALVTAPWPGNVRQLLNVVERATIVQPHGEIEPGHLGLSARAVPVE